MRIIAGKLRGSTLFFPKNKITRPLKDRARESIFNLLEHSNKILFKFKKSNVLDLYSGIGSFGLECLSRQAENVYFIERNNDVFKILKKNIEKLRLDDRANIYFRDVLNLIVKPNIFKLKFDLIFFDPPFKDSNIEKLIQLIFDNNFVKKNSIIVIHRHKNSVEKFPNNFKIIEVRSYGVSKIIFGKFLF
jgi:16S rRNA (guanine966-N2)-methyltransferase